MEGDRIVVREEEVLEQKKGFRLFGRKAKSKGKQASVSRPPSAASFPSWKAGKPGVAASSSAASMASVATSATAVAAVDDDDLPAREEHPVAGSSTAGVTPVPSKEVPASSATSPAEEDPPTPKVPLRAGFDFGAMKDVIDRERGDVPANDGTPLELPRHLVAATLERTQASMYPADTASDDITAGFSRPLTLEPGRRASWSHSSVEEEEERAPETARPVPAPAISFAATDGTIWPTPSTTEPRWSPYGTGVTPPSDPYASRNPFTASTISFGGADGSVTTVTTAAAGAAQPKKTAWSPSNPWD